MRNPGRVLSKSELLDHVWDAADDLDPNVVEVYAGYLRRKLGRARLETVRGAGYRRVPGARAPGSCARHHTGCYARRYIGCYARRSPGWGP